MNAAMLISHCQEFGAILVPEGEHLSVRAPEPLPPDILEELRQHKSEVIAHLAKKQYPLKYPNGPATEQELSEIEGRVLTEGYVLLWSNTLSDFVAFYKTEADRGKIPPGFVPYSDEELHELFGEGKAICSLRIIHEARREFGRLIIQRGEEDMK